MLSVLAAPAADAGPNALAIHILLTHLGREVFSLDIDD